MRGGIALVLAIGTLLVSISSWSENVSDEMLYALNMESFSLAVLAQEKYGMPMERRPRIIVQKTVNMGGYDAWSDCRHRYIEVDRWLVINDLDYVLRQLLAHEYAHHVTCYLRGGNVGPEPHDEIWSEISVSLGGPSENQRRER